MRKLTDLNRQHVESLKNVTASRSITLKANTTQKTMLISKQTNADHQHSVKLQLDSSHNHARTEAVLFCAQVYCTMKKRYSMKRRDTMKGKKKRDAVQRRHSDECRSMTRR